MSTAPSIEKLSRAARHRTIAAVVVATAIVLVLTASTQIFDANFYAMTGAVSLLSGDRIYRDFFEPGVPLAAYTAALGQLVSGYRIIGEFARQWLFILAGVGIAVHLGLRLSRSIVATLAMMTIALLIVSVTPIYHHDKLFFFPLIVWVCWRYIDRPTMVRGAVCGAVTAIAFLFRHDYGVYLGATSIGTFLLARVAAAESRSVSAMLHDAGAYAMAVAIVLAPWLIAVEITEGLVDYTQSRAQLFEGTPGIAYGSLLHIDPIKTFTLRANADAIVWIQQMALLVSIGLVVSGLWQLWTRRRSNIDRTEGCCIVLAGGFLVVIDYALLRQPSYVLVVAPITAALAARYLVSRSAPVRTVATTLAVLTMLAAFVWIKGTPLYYLNHPVGLFHSVRATFARLVASPPDYEFLPFQYLRDCTAAGDHILVTGGTPLHVSYYAHRPIAGGHLRWRRGWRSDPVHEAQSLALLERQSVPIALSTADPVLDTFKSYPRIHAYLEKYYVPIDPRGFILVDTRRRPTGTFSPLNYPCFR